MSLPRSPRRSWILRSSPVRRMRAPAESHIPCTGVLEECPAQYGYLLWRSLRNVHLWAETPPADRGELFGEGAHERRMADVLSVSMPEALEAPLATLAALLGAAQRIEPSAIASACLGIAAWAGRERPRTALEFSQAAAMACPNDAHLSLVAGRAARDVGLGEAAETWLGRAITISRSLREWNTYGLSHLAMGKLRIMRGNFPSARRHLLRALDRSRRHGINDLRAMSLHGLLVVETECSNPALADRYAAQALIAYADVPEEQATLAQDVAYLWMEQGYFAEALKVLGQLCGRIHARGVPHLHGAIARCAGAVGASSAFGESVASLQEHENGPGIAAAWANVAYGALSLGRWDEARDAAERAKAIALARGEHKVVFLSESLLDQAARESRPSVEHSTLAESRSELADHFVLTLETALA